MNKNSENEIDEYRNDIMENIDELIKLEPDPLDRTLLEIAIPLSYILSGLIKGGILLASWVFTIIWTAQIFEYFGKNVLTHFIYFFISFCMGGLSVVIIQFLWRKYVSYDRKKRI